MITKMNNVIKKKILLTGYYFDAFSGSMVHICEIGKYMKELGYDVYIGSVIIDNKIIDYCYNKLGINLMYLDEIPTDIEFDIIWAYHFPNLAYLLSRGIKYKKLITGCLSGLLHPLETPLPFCKDNNIPIYVNSGETKTNILNKYPEYKDNIDILPNLIPEEYAISIKSTPPPERNTLYSNSFEPYTTRTKKFAT